MAQVGNTQDRFGGEFMVQDSNHMSEISNASNVAHRGVRQHEQSQSGDRQQGSSDQNASTQQGGQMGGERNRKSR